MDIAFRPIENGMKSLWTTQIAYHDAFISIIFMLCPRLFLKCCHHSLQSYWRTCFPLSATQSSLGQAWLSLGSSRSFMVSLEASVPAGPRPIVMRMGSRRCGVMWEVMREGTRCLDSSLTVCIVFCGVLQGTDYMDICGPTQHLWREKGQNGLSNGICIAKQECKDCVECLGVIDNVIISISNIPPMSLRTISSRNISGFHFVLFKC